MTQISPVTQATTTPASSTSSSKGIASDFDAFLTMLTVQMKNQDPLNPIESADYAVQLATFAGVEQQTRSNELLEQIAGRIGGGTLSDYAEWIGQQVAAPASASFEGAPLTLLPDYPADATRAVIEVKAGGGSIIERIELPLESGPVTWEGRSPDGTAYLTGEYVFETVGYKGDAEIARQTTAVYQEVREVRTGPTGAQIVLESGTTISPEKVQAIRPG